MRILLADDHELVRRGLRELLSRSGYEICGEVASGREAVDAALELKPDIVVMDISMPGLNGLEATRQIVHAAPQIQVLIVSMHESDQVIHDALSAGARGFVLKSDSGAQLLAALEAFRKHSLYFSPKLADTVLQMYLKGPGQSADSRSGDRLTKREREIVQLLAEGKSNKEVAVVLKLSIKTVETHRSNIMNKLGLHSLSSLVRYAIRNGIVEA